MAVIQVAVDNVKFAGATIDLLKHYDVRYAFIFQSWVGTQGAQPRCDQFSTGARVPGRK